MKNELLTTRKNARVLEVELNRPEVLNSFNCELQEQLLRTLDEFEGDKSLHALLLMSAGKGFSAGQDLAEITQAEKAGAPLPFDKIVERYNSIIKKITHSKKPVVCAVQGIAAGAGANLALACDFVVASEKASFLQAFVNIGLVPDSGGTYFLPRLLGIARTKELIMLGEKLPAEEAARLGLIYRVYPEATCLEEARKLATRLSELPQKSLALMKKLLLEGATNSLDAQLECELHAQVEASKSADYREGITAFIEKRKPTFGRNEA